MSALPSSRAEDIEDVVAALGAVENRVLTLVTDLSDRELNWQPAPGRWSIGECLDHLNRTNALYLDGMEPALAHAREAGWVRRGPIAPGWFARRFIRSLEPPPRFKGKAPRAARPAASLSRDEVWTTFQRTQARVRRIAADGADLDLNRATFPNPFMRRITVRLGSALLIIAAHERRHVWQAEQVRAAQEGREPFR